MDDWSHMHATWTESDPERRDEVVRLGLWMFLATVAMLFAAFASAYLVRRGSSDWTAIALPPVLWLNTLVLAAGSVSLEAGRAWGLGRRWAASSWALGAAVGLGVGFLGGQLVAWRALMADGIFLPDGPHASFLYTLTAAHAVHVVAALVLLTVAAAQTWTGLGRRDFARWTLAMDATRTFWHFLLGVWIFVFLLLAFY
jgi:cytochrome c oxidase subunit 3